MCPVFPCTYFAMPAEYWRGHPCALQSEHRELSRDWQIQAQGKTKRPASEIPRKVHIRRWKAPPLFHLDWTMNHRFYFLSEVPCLQPFQKPFSMVGSPEASVPSAPQCLAGCRVTCFPPHGGEEAAALSQPGSVSFSSRPASWAAPRVRCCPGLRLPGREKQS